MGKFTYHVYLLCFLGYTSHTPTHALAIEVPPVIVHVHNHASSGAHSTLLNDQQFEVNQTLFGPTDWLSTGQSWLERYSRLLAGCGIATLYGVLYERVLVLNAYFTSPSWSVWKEHLDLNRLATVNEQELIDQLLLDIQQGHLNPGNPRDSLSPLVEFLKVLDEEEKMIKEYLFLHKWTKLLLIGRTLPFIESEVTDAYQRIDRLAFVKQLFQKWAVEQNFAALTS